MKIGFNETLSRATLEQDLAWCVKYQYDVIEIRFDKLEAYLQTHTLDELKAFFDSHPLKPYSLNAIVDVNFCDDAAWSAVKQQFTSACEISQQIGNPYIVVCPTERADMRDKTEDAVLRDAVRVLTELSDIAKPYGVGIAYEPIGKPRFCVRSIRQTADIIQAVDRDNVGMTFDTFNLYVYDELKDLQDMRQIPVEKLFVFHFNDAQALPIEQMEPAVHRLYPGDGVIPLHDFLSILKEMGYDGPASIELFGDCFEAVDPETVMRIGYEKTKAVLNAAAVL